MDYEQKWKELKEKLKEVYRHEKDAVASSSGKSELKEFYHEGRENQINDILTWMKELEES